MPYPINASCNLDCVFCDRSWSDEPIVDDALVLRDAPMSELSGMRATLAGGEPTLHPRLPELLSGLRQQGVKRLAIRTNAAWAARKEPVDMLYQSGLREVSVVFPTDDARLFDKLTRKANAYLTVMAGISNLRAADIRLVLRIPLIKPTLAALPDMLARLPDLIADIKRIDLVCLDIHDPDLLVTMEDINRTLPFRSQHPDPRVPPITLDPGPGIALCWADKMAGWQITPDCPTARSHHPAPCDRCFVKHNCPGVSRGYVEVFGDEVVQPMELPVLPLVRAQETKRGRLPVVMNGAAFEPVQGMTYECAGDGAGEQKLASVRLRVGHACNRRCEFCFIPHHDKSVQDYDIRASITAAAKQGVRELVMTGGEPTLVAELPEYIQQARDLGVRRLILQTNAIRLADEGFSQKLAAAGLTNVTVSLHSHRDDILEQITGQGRTMPKVLRGLQNMIDAGVKTSITHVIGPKNYKLLPEFVEFMGRYVSGFCFIFATPMAGPMATKDIVVRYADAAPYLMKALDYCIEHGIVFDGPALKCGMPHCVVGGEPKYLGDAELIPENNRGDDWMRIPACEQCVLSDQCYGVRRLYAYLYGIDEFSPVLEAGKQAARVAPQTTLGEARDDHRFATKLVQSVGDAIGLSKEQLADLSRPDEELVFEVDEQLAFRVRYRGEHGDSMGAVEISASLDLTSCREQALVRRIRAAAFGVPLGGAHGGVAAAADEHTEALSRGYVDALSEQRWRGSDYLTPHTSTPWQALVEQIDARDHRQLGALRRWREDLSMTSLDSAVAAACAALERLAGPKRDDDPLDDQRGIVRYLVWGYGRAGRRFAELMDNVSLADGRRPMLIGCADTRSSWIDQRGLLHERISAFKCNSGTLPRGRGTVFGPGELCFEPADVLLLSGRGAPFAVADAAKVKARVIIDMTGAISPPLERALRDAAVLVVPSVISTCGPMLVAELEQRGVQDAAAIRAEIKERTAAVLTRVLDRSTGGALSMTEALVALGLEALAGRS